VAAKRRDLRRAEHSARALDAAAKITEDDIAHAARTWREIAPPERRNMLQCPDYRGDGVPSDEGREL
jgi:hypothetical protein